jgi:hypothetical protein
MAVIESNAVNVQMADMPPADGKKIVLSAQQVDNSSISLAWTVEGVAQNFTIYRKQGAGTYAMITEPNVIPGATRSFLDAGSAESPAPSVPNIYTYKVTANMD